MTNSKKEIIKAKLVGETDKAKILELENELEQLETRQKEESANVAQSNNEIAGILTNIQKQTMTKSPACRMDEESFDDCVSRKVPELMDEGYSQEQAVAIASSVCSIPCSEKIEIPKEFEISNAKQITEEINKAIEKLNKSNQDNLEKIVATSYKEIAEALNKLATKEQKVVVKREQDNIVVNIPTSARKPMAVRLSDGDRFYNAIFAGLGQSNDGIIREIQRTYSFDANANITANININGTVATFTETDGEKTLTSTIDYTDPNDIDITEVWS
jgi:hypothetical protein